MALFRIKADTGHIHIFFTCMLVALIPFARVWISYAVFLWLVSAIVLMIRHKDTIGSFRFDAGLLFSILLYLVFVTGVFYSSNSVAAIFDIQVKLTLLLIPPFIFLLREFYRKYSNIILAVFVLANVFAGLICIGGALYHSIHLQNGSLIFNSTVPGIYEDSNTALPTYFKYVNFSLFKHPAYFSMYLLLCIFILAHFYRNSFYILKSGKKSKILYIILMAYLILIIYLLESKAAYLILFLLSFFYTAVYTISQKKWIFGVVLVVAIVAISIYGYRQNTRFFYINSALKNRTGFMEALEKKDYQVFIDSYGINRVPIWMLSAEIIKEHFWTGVGSGDVKENLMIKYKKYELLSLQESKLNTHNQYLETFVAVGIIGFLIFLSWLLYPLLIRKHYNKKGFLILVLTGILIISYLFEATLNTIAGVIFIAFFYSFLLYVPVDLSTKKIDL
jgi:O-antigen ligase